MTQILSVPIHNLSQSEIKVWIRNRITAAANASVAHDFFYHIATVNPEFLVAAQKNKKFADILKHKTALNVCDGYGIKFWAKLLYKKNVHRVTGVELAETLCRIAATQKKSVYFLGGFGVADKAAKIMKLKYPDLIIAGAEDGDPNKISDQMKSARPDVVLVAFGAPKQEFWLQKFGAESGAKIGIGIGGTFDFWTGKAIRAPKILRSMGLEWLWRLLTEPKRWQRIWTATVVFSWMVVLCRMGISK